MLVLAGSLRIDPAKRHEVLAVTIELMRVELGSLGVREIAVERYAIQSVGSIV